jgi:hypothetical protein
MLVVKHAKPGEKGRPSHLHIVFPRRDVATGRLIRDSYHKTKNDRLAVQLDAEFEAGTIVPIVHAQSVDRWLATNDPATLVMIEAAGGLKKPDRKPQDTPTASEKRRAGGSGIDLGDFAKRVLGAFDAAKGSPNETDWFASGLRLARGKKNVMVLDLATGFCGPLYRNLNAAAKRHSDARRWNDAELTELLLAEAPSLSAAVAASKWPDPKAKRRGRKPAASQDEIAAEAARVREIEANVARNKAEAKAARHGVGALGRKIERIDTTAPSLGTTSKGMVFASIFVGPAAAAGVAAAVLINILLRGQQRRQLAERRRKAIAAADVRRRLGEYFAEVRRRRLTRSDAETRRQIVGPAVGEAKTQRPDPPLPAKALLPEALAQLSPSDAAFVFLAAVAALDGISDQPERRESAHAQFEALTTMASMVTRDAFAALVVPIESEAQVYALSAVLNHFKSRRPANSDISSVARAAGGEVARIVEAEERTKIRTHELG